MRVNSNNGVCTFIIAKTELQLYLGFIKNKKFSHTTSFFEVWTYNFEWPKLLIKGKNYFGKTAERDFYSENKEEIFKELNLIENENGIFYFETYNAGQRLTAIQGNPLTGKGFLQLGDYVMTDKVKSLKIGYDFQNDIWSGVYGI